MNLYERLMALIFGEEEGELPPQTPVKLPQGPISESSLQGEPAEAIMRLAKENFPDNKQAQELYALLAASEQMAGMLASRQMTKDSAGRLNEDGIARGLTQVEKDTAANMLLNALINKDTETVEAILEPLLQDDGDPYMVGKTPIPDANTLLTSRASIGLKRNPKGQRLAKGIIQDYLDYAEEGETQEEKDRRRLDYEKIINRQRIKDLEREEGTAFRAAGGQRRAEVLEAMEEPIVENVRMNEAKEQAKVLGLPVDPFERPETLGEAVPAVLEQGLPLDDETIQKLVDLHDQYNKPKKATKPEDFKKKLSDFR